METSPKRRAMYAARGISTAIPNGAGMPLAFNSQGVNPVPVGYEDPQGFQFAGAQIDSFYASDGDPFGSIESATSETSSATGLNGFADLYGTTLSNQSTMPPATAFGVMPTTADGGAILRPNSTVQTVLIISVAVVAVAYLFYRRKRG